MQSPFTKEVINLRGNKMGDMGGVGEKTGKKGVMSLSSNYF